MPCVVQPISYKILRGYNAEFIILLWGITWKAVTVEIRLW